MGSKRKQENWRILEYCGDPILRIGYRYHHELIDYNIDLMAKKNDIKITQSINLYESLFGAFTQEQNVVFAETKRV